MGLFSGLFGGGKEKELPPLIPLDKFVPENQLEEKLKGFIEGRDTVKDVMEAMLATQVFLPSMAEPEEMRQGKVKFCVLENPAQGDMAAVFTAPSRSDTVRELLPGLKSAFLAEAKWVFRIVPEDLGIIINPGWQAGLEMPAKGLVQFKKDYGLDKPE